MLLRLKTVLRNIAVNIPEQPTLINRNTVSASRKDSNGIKYSAYEHELTQEELKIGIDERKKLKIKFYSKYSSSKKIQKIVFSNLILDYEKYNYLNNKSLFDSYGILEMDI